LPARAEVDIARLKTAIEVSVEGDYPKHVKPARVVNFTRNGEKRFEV
jgi:hypothetical protein